MKKFLKIVVSDFVKWLKRLSIVNELKIIGAAIAIVVTVCVAFFILIYTVGLGIYALFHESLYGGTSETINYLLSVREILKLSFQDQIQSFVPFTFAFIFVSIIGAFIVTGIKNAIPRIIKYIRGVKSRLE